MPRDPDEFSGRHFRDRPGVPPRGTVLCRLDEIAEPGAKGFEFGSGTERFDMFVIRFGGDVHAYVNDCPHAHSPLDWLPDRFFDRELRHLLCATHGALFRPDDGVCVRGPCEGKSLDPVPVAIEDGVIVIGE